MNHAAEPSVVGHKPFGRRMLRYSVRTVLVLITFVCSFLGWVTAEWRQSKFERQVGEDLEDQGARVYFVGVYDSLELHDSGEPQGWWRDRARDLLGERVSRVVVSDYEIESLDMLPSLTKLRSLGLAGSTIDDLDLTPLSRLHNLTNFHLYRNAVDDVTPLSGLKRLKDLSLFSTSVSDISPLAKLQDLETLSLSETAVNDLTPLSGMRQLKTLDLTRTPVSDISPLAGLKSLTELSIVNTAVSDVSPIVGLRRLRSLLLGGAVAGDVSCLAGLKSLEELHIEVSGVSPLEDIVAVLSSGKLANLKYLAISGDQFNDDSLSRLGSLPSVERLVLRRTSISDESIQHIAAMPRLDELDIRDTHVSKHCVQQLKTKMPSLRVSSSR